jgi:hypothetical protein
LPERLKKGRVMAFELLERGSYVEFRLFGVVDGASTPDPELLQRFADVGRVLVNATDVESITADVMWMASIVSRALAVGSFRTAVHAEDDVVFGVLRQVSVYRGESPPEAGVGFFRNRAEALSWLLAPG